MFRAGRGYNIRFRRGGSLPGKDPGGWLDGPINHFINDKDKDNDKDEDDMVCDKPEEDKIGSNMGWFPPWGEPWWLARRPNKPFYYH